MTLLRALCPPCREREYVAVNKHSLGDLYPCQEDDSGLFNYLGDLCKRGRHEWAEYIILVSALYNLH